MTKLVKEYFVFVFFQLLTLFSYQPLKFQGLVSSLIIKEQLVQPISNTLTEKLNNVDNKGLIW